MRTLLCLSLLLAATAIQAEIQTKAITYEDEDAKLTGYLYWDDAVAGKRPGILVVHEWWGLNDYAKKRARMLLKAISTDFLKGRTTCRATDPPRKPGCAAVGRSPAISPSSSFPSALRFRPAPAFRSAEIPGGPSGPPEGCPEKRRRRRSFFGGGS